MHRLLDHYLHTAHAADRLLVPAPATRSPWPRPSPGVTPEDLADHEQALAWFAAEHPVLLAAVGQAAATGFDTHAWQLAWTPQRPSSTGGGTGTTGPPPSSRRGRRPAAGRPATRRRTPTAASPCAYTRLGRFDDAHTHLRHALDLLRRARRPDRAGPHPPQPRRSAFERRGRHGRRSSTPSRPWTCTGPPATGAGQADALNAVGWYHAQLGDHQQALTCCQQALALHQELGDRDGAGRTPGTASATPTTTSATTPRPSPATSTPSTCYRDLGDRYNEADTLTHLGDTHHAAGDPDAARDAWQQALTILDELDHPDADQVRAKLGGLTGPTGDRADE